MSNNFTIRDKLPEKNETKGERLLYECHFLERVKVKNYLDYLPNFKDKYKCAECGEAFALNPFDKKGCCNNCDTTYLKDV